MISIIVAMDRNRVIGKDNKLPWHYKDDLKYFREVTTGHDILMGRNTFESILSYRGAPLPKRRHIVATSRGMSDVWDDVFSISDVDGYVSSYPECDELFVIGGARVYEDVLPVADRLYITHIDGEFDGDAFFPEVDFGEWDELTRDVRGELCFAVYERKRLDG